MKTSDMRRQLYGAIMGPTVTEVLDNKSLIAGDHTGIDEASVDKASVATENLRVLLSTYFSYKTEEEKYTYYALNHNAFKSNFIALFHSLDLFYNNGTIRAGLNKRGLKEKYEILLAQLFYTVNALSDTPVLNYDGTKYYNSNYSFEGKKAIDILQGNVYIEDKNNAAPIAAGYPAPVEKPAEIAEVLEPAKPTVVKKPIAPEPVEDPGDVPVAVSRPRPIVKMDPPFELSDPNTLPDTVAALVAEYRVGGIVERANKTSTVRIKVGAYLTIKIKNTDKIIVRFFDADGNQLGVDLNVERGSFIEYDGQAPTKAEDDYATYEFTGWKNGSGDDAQRVDMTSVNCDGAELNLYPAFEATPKLYKVCWNIEGELTYTYECLDAVPTAPDAPATLYEDDDPEGFYNGTMTVATGDIDYLK